MANKAGKGNSRYKHGLIGTPEYNAWQAEKFSEALQAALICIDKQNQVLANFIADIDARNLSIIDRLDNIEAKRKIIT